MNKKVKKNRKAKQTNIWMVITIIVTIALLVVAIYTYRNYKFEKAKQDVLLFGNMAISNYSKDYGYKDNISLSYALKDVNKNELIDVCPINGKKYDDSTALVNYNERDKRFRVSAELKCGIYSIHYNFEIDYRDLEHDEWNIYNISISKNK